MTTTVYVPRDAAALSLGADEVARGDRGRSARRAAVDVRHRAQRLARHVLARAARRGGTVERRASRYGRSRTADVAGLFDCGFPRRRRARAALGPTEEIPYFAKQQRLTFARVGVIDPLSARRLSRARRLSAACERAGDDAASDIVAGGHRLGPARPRRRGVSRPASSGRRCSMRRPTQKYIVCNADEGDSGTFADRMLMEGDPFVLDRRHDDRGPRGRRDAGLHLPALRISARASRAATRRSQRAYAARLPRRRTSSAAAGASISRCGSAPAPTSAAKKPRCSRASKASAARSAVGRRCRRSRGCSASRRSSTTSSRSRACRSFSTRAREFYRDFGVGRSRGTLPIQLAGNIKHGGLVERAFGVTLRELLYDYGGGTRDRPADPRRAGRRSARRLSARVAVRHAARLRGVRGHRRDARPRRHRRVRRHGRHGASMARYAMEFCAIESCGKCTPCRIGSTRGVEVIDRIIAAASERDGNLALLEELCETMVARFAVRLWAA